MEDPKLIAILIPTDRRKLAENAFCLEHNSDRYLAPTRCIKESRILSSRDPTPADEELVDDHCKYDFTHRIKLSFKTMPKDPTKGFCFGSNSQICDVLLGHREEGISNVHFYITFNEKQKLILKDSSTCGTAVSYDGQAKEEVRHHFTWILEPEKEEEVWEIEVRVRGRYFKVEFASHQSCAAEYKKNVEEFLASLNNLTFNGLGIYTPTELPSLSLTPRRSPIYISERELGRGSFGGVDKVIDVSTGAIYARKSFFEPHWGKYKRQREQEREDWLSRVRREIRIMKDSQHENIVKVVDALYEPIPFLVMEYLCSGNLEDLNNMRDFCEKEAVGLLYQALNALGYLHARGIAHRDLKPANILIESRTPLLIKLADFGFANDKPDLATVCGTHIYLAPEVYSGMRYTTVVDLWSLGVIILEYAHGLPSTKLQIPRKKYEAWGLAWCRRIIDHANDWDSDALIDFLTAGLLQMTPAERLSADACLRKGRSIGLFDGGSSDSGTVTPRPGSALQPGISDFEGATTIVLGALWGKDDVNSIQDDKSGSGRFSTLQHTSRARDSHTNKDRHSYSSQVGGFETSSPPTGKNDQSLANPLHPIETIPRVSKRLRSPAIGPANNSSSRGRVKRRTKENFHAELLVGRSDKISNRQPTQYGTSYDAVLALLMDLWLGDSKSQEMDMDDHTSILIGELCDYLTKLEITGMRLAQNNLSGQTIFATGSNGREIMLASLTSSKLMSSITDLVMHLLQMVQLQSFSVSGTPIAHKDQPQIDAVAQGHRSQSWKVDRIGSSATMSSAREYGVTYPSALLDCINVSDCSIPTKSKQSTHMK